VPDIPPEIQEFILERIDSVPQLEALLLMRAGVGQSWQASAIARHLYIQPRTARELLRALHERDLIMLVDAKAPAYRYGPATSELIGLVDALAVTYATNLIAVSNLIHSKPSRSIQGLADALRPRDDE
jgi:hypothetical protein